MFNFSTSTREEWIAFNVAEAERADSVGEPVRASRHRANIADALKEVGA